MTDVLIIIAIAASCSGAVGLLGVLFLPALRRRSVRHAFAAVALVAVLAFVAGLLGAARAMFLSQHDFRVTLIVCAVAGLVSLGVAVRLARQVALGSQQLRAAARDLGDEGRYVAPSRPPTSELEALSRELEEASRKLARARERERALESSRRDLVAWVSHDLRSPLAGLRAMAEALEDGIAEDASRYHRQMRVEVDRLARMVDDLFELSRIHAGALSLSFTRVSLPDLVSDTLAGADALARARGVRLSGHAGPEPHTAAAATAGATAGTVAADARELSRMLTNLVVNAIQHTPYDGAVVVEADIGDHEAVLAVTDACGGIPTADLDHVFGVAWRGTHARTPEADGGAPDGAAGTGGSGIGGAGTGGAGTGGAGTGGAGTGGSGGGLGLAIVRGIVEAHQGSVSVRNVDRGCRFEVHLPLSLPEMVDAAG